ncbi:MAG: aminoacyl-tRNA hydrolase [Blastocatellia bacterium]
MKLIVGLGNPGEEYEATRHNLGFMLVDRLFERTGGRRFRSELSARTAEVTLAGQRVLLVKPQTFMNLSGDAVKPLLERYGEDDAANLIVASDEAALPFGMIRVRARGSAGGQKGLKSIIDRLGSGEFARVRMGVRPDHPVSDLASFVLAKVPRRDREALNEVLDRAAEAVEVVLAEGVERAMQRFNERVKEAIKVTRRA